MPALRNATTEPMWLAGLPVHATSGETYDVVDPSTDEVLAQVPAADAHDAERAVTSAFDVAETQAWARVPLAERVEVLHELARRAATVAAQDSWAQLESSDSGATLRRTAGVDVPYAVACLAAFAELAAAAPWEVDLPPSQPGVRNVVDRVPLGVVAGITPFNAPLLMAVWKMAPALAAGCSVVLKPSPLTPLTTLRLARLVVESGLLPAGTLNVLTGPSPQLGAALVSDPRVAMVSFTGSTATGRRIAAAAGARLARTTLELGGKSAGVVCADADLDVAVDGAVFAAFHHAGQICVSGTRLYVHDDVYEVFVQRLLERVSGLRVGPALDLATQVGPLASHAQVDAVEGFLARARREGLEPAVGGHRLDPNGDGTGCFLAPAVFLDVPDGAEIMCEEVFGPVLSVARWRDPDDVVSRVNDTRYGLAAGVWSSDVPQATVLARRLRAGTVWVNDWHSLRVDAPFGGFGESGLGREFGIDGILSHTEPRHLHLDAGAPRAERPLFDLVLG